MKLSKIDFVEAVDLIMFSDKKVYFLKEVEAVPDSIKELKELNESGTIFFTGEAESKHDEPVQMPEFTLTPAGFEIAAESKETYKEMDPEPVDITEEIFQEDEKGFEEVDLSDEEIIDKPEGIFDVKPEKKDRYSFDSGKAAALWKAGWKVKDIADELHVCAATIHNFLKKEGLK